MYIFLCVAEYELMTLNSVFKTVAIFIVASPRGINYREVLQELQKVTGVKMAHSLHMWSLTMDKAALSVHLAVGKFDIIMERRPVGCIF